MQDNNLLNDEIIDVAICSGGGANGYWQWRTLMELHEAGYRPKMITGTSTGCLTAFLYAKGLFTEGELLYKETYSNDAKNISKSGIAEIKNGKIKVHWFKLIPKIFRANRISSLMDNEPLYDILLKLDKQYPGFHIPFGFHYASLQTGKSIASFADEFDTPEERCKAIVASTTMPIIWKLKDAVRSLSASYRSLGDGGILDGLPLNIMIDKMIPGKKYRAWSLECNKIDLVEDNDLNNIFKIAGRLIQMFLNEIFKGDLQRTLDRNKIAIKTDPLIDELYSKGETELADRFSAAIGFRYIPVHRLTYPGDRGVFDFTLDAFNEHAKLAKDTVREYLQQKINAIS